jgi:hypothetical protein
VIRTQWKSRSELELALRDAKRVAVISCATCANIIDTGGETGLKAMRQLLKEINREVTLEAMVIACCAEELMRPTFKMYQRALAKSDAIVVISCAGGVKAASLCSPGLPVIAALDTMGSMPVTFRDTPVTRSMCSACGQCVLTFTGGICPLGECPSKRKYGPCDKAPTEGTHCGVAPEQDCVWVEIQRCGNMQALGELEKIHQAGGQNLFTPVMRVSPLPKGRSVWKMAAHVLLLDRLGNYLLKLMLSGFTRFYAFTIRKYKDAQEVVERPGPGG